MGFTFDDSDKKGVATPLSEMRRLIAQDPRNQEVIFPYIGGEEINTSPTHAHHRYIINFRDFPLRREDIDAPPVAAQGKTKLADGRSARGKASWVGATDEQRRAWLQQGRVPFDYQGPVAADWPDLLAIVDAKVKPSRTIDGRAAYRTYWWQYAEKRKELSAAIIGLERVLVISQTSKTTMFTFLPTTRVYSTKVGVFPYKTCAAFCGLQARPHENWARFFGSTLEDRLVYTPSDCFATFPFPDGWETDSTLESAGEAYYEFRASLMVRNDDGLTTTYNRFHDPYDDDPDILKLREFHAAMDRAVLDAYGWTDIPTDCEFLLDYEIDEETWGNKKKPYRYRWPDEIRDEVLARLLELNAERAAAEARAGRVPRGKVR